MFNEFDLSQFSSGRSAHLQTAIYNNPPDKSPTFFIRVLSE